MSDLHGKIMNLQCKHRNNSEYMRGHRDARHSAAELANESDARIAELEKERDQWQESSGQNYVRAYESEMREARLQSRIAELQAENERSKGENAK